MGRRNYGGKKSYKIFLDVALISFIAGGALTTTLFMANDFNNTNEPTQVEEKIKVNPSNIDPNPEIKKIGNNVSINGSKVEMHSVEIKGVFKNIRAEAENVKVYDAYEYIEVNDKNITKFSENLFKIVTYNVNSKKKEDIKKYLFDNKILYKGNIKLLCGYKPKNGESPTIDYEVDHENKIIKVYRPKEEILEVVITKHYNVYKDGEGKGLLVVRGDDFEDETRNTSLKNMTSKVYELFDAYNQGKYYSYIYNELKNVKDKDLRQMHSNNFIEIENKFDELVYTSRKKFEEEANIIFKSIQDDFANSEHKYTIIVLPYKFKNINKN